MSSDNTTNNPLHQKYANWNEKTNEMNSIKKIASKKFNDLSFEKEFKTFFLFALTGKTLCNIVSFGTMYIALVMVWSNWFGWYGSNILALLTSVFLESMKTIIVNLSSKYILKYKMVRKITILPALFIVLVTVSLSLVGAYYLPFLKQDTTSSGLVSVVDIEALKSDTLAISQARKEASKYFSNVSKEREGKTYISSTKKGSQNEYDTKQSIVSSLVLLHQKQIEEALEKNKIIEQENKEKVKANIEKVSEENKIERWIFVSVAFFLEVLFLILSFACSFYLIWVWVDSIEDPNEKESIKNTMNRKLQFDFSNQKILNEIEEKRGSESEKKSSIQIIQGEKQPAVQMTAVQTAESTVSIEIEPQDKPAVQMAENGNKEGFCMLGECEKKFEKTIYNKKFCCTEHQQLYNQKKRLIDNLKNV